MNYSKTEISPLLRDVVNDNPTYPFPIDSIKMELLNLLINQQEFDYFMMMIYKKLKQDHPIIFSEVFLTTVEFVLDTKSNNPYMLSQEEYELKIDQLITTLEIMVVTRVEKKSPDGEMMSAML
jgi:hypothetical protein